MAKSHSHNYVLGCAQVPQTIVIFLTIVILSGASRFARESTRAVERSHLSLEFMRPQRGFVPRNLQENSLPGRCRWSQTRGLSTPPDRSRANDPAPLEMTDLVR